MGNANVVGRLQLKSKLLIGVAGLAAVTASAAAAADPASTPPASDPKWLPYVDVNGGVGDGFAQGRADLYAPLWQDMDSLLFARIGVGTQTHNDEILNFGLGYRSKVNPDWILGAYLGVDNTHTDLSHNFSQYGLGLEMMSADWDVRANGYLAKHNPLTGNNFELYIHDTTIAILQSQQAALSGFDGEVGYRIFHTDDTDMRLFAGVFSFQHRQDVDTVLNGQDFNFSYRGMTGPRGRVEVNMFDIDVLGPQSRLSLDGEISHDRVRGTSGFAGATLRIPLGAVVGQGGQMLDDLDRRMADPVRRQDDVLTEWQFNKPEPVVIYNGHVTSHPTNTLYYVAGNTEGAGTYADPTTLNDAVSRDGANAFVVVTDLDGNVGASNAQAGPNETIVGGGQTFSVRGVNSGRSYTHTFAPGSGTPTIVANNPGDDILDVSSGDALQDLNFGGPFDAAIHGHNVDALDITQVNIDGSGGGQYGVLVDQSASSDLALHISDTSITGVTVDGVYVDTNVSDGGISNQTLELTNSTISGSGIADVVMTSAISGGSTVNQHIVIDPTTISESGYGIVIGARVNGGTLDQDVSISDVTVNDVSHAGIVIYAYGDNSANVTQHITLDNVKVYGNFTHGGEGAFAKANFGGEGGGLGSYTYGDLIAIGAGAFSGADVTQTFSLTNVTANGALNDAVFVAAYSGSSGSVTQSGMMDQLAIANGVTTIAGYHNYGIFAGAYSNGGMTTQHVSISYADISGVTGAGVVGYAYGGAHANVHQNISLDHVDVSGLFGGVELAASPNVSAGTNTYAYGDLVAIEAASYGASFVSQDFGLSYVTASGALYDDVAIEAVSKTGGTVHQSGAMDHIVADDAIYGDGVDVGGYAGGSSHMLQHVGVSHLTATGNYFDGFDARLGAYGHHAVAAQYVQIDHATLTGNIDGVDASVFAAQKGSSRQDLTLTHANLSNNEYGLQGLSYAINSGSTQQTLTLAFDNASNEGNTGISLVAAGLTEGFAEQTANIYHSNVTHNGESGLFAGATGYVGGDAEQNVNIYNTRLNSNGADGLDIETIAYGLDVGSGGSLYYSHVTQNVIAAYDTMFNNGEDGVHIHNIAQYGGQVDQFVYLFGDRMNNNARDGVYEKTFAISPGVYGYAPGTAAYADLYVVGTAAHPSSAEFNGSFGVYVGSLAQAPLNPADVFGKTYLIQHIEVGGTQASHNMIGGFGDGAYDQGIYSLNIQYVTLANSKFDHNGQFGAGFLAAQYFGPYSFGAAIQDVTIAHSDFSYNGEYGLAAIADASGFQGRAEQNFDISSSLFDHNGNDGIYLYRHAHDGAYYPGYACTAAQGVIGGCAFVRQTVQLNNSRSTYNGGDGLYLKTIADNYGAVYTASTRPQEPTLVIYDSVLNHNQGDGLDIYNDVGAGSYLYQYVLAIGSHFDRNKGDGIYLGNHVHDGGFVGQLRSYQQGSSTYTYLFPGSKLTLYQSTVDYNKMNGVELLNDVSGASVLDQYVLDIDSHIDHNAGYGIVSHSYATGGSTLQQTISLYTYVPPDEQTFAAVTTTVNHNGATGIEDFVYSNGGGSKYSAVYSALKLQNADVSYNGHSSVYGGGGVYMGLYGLGMGSAVQYFYAANSRFAHDAGLGAGVLDESVGDLLSAQYVASSGNLFAYNSSFGLGVAQLDYGSLLAGQVLTSYGDTFTNNGAGGLVQIAGFAGTYGAVQISYIKNDTVTAVVHGGSLTAAPSYGFGLYVPQNDGIAIDLVASGTLAASAHYLIGDHVYNSHGTGIDIGIGALNGASISDYTLMLGDVVNGSHGDGVYLESVVTGGSRIAQQVMIGYSSFDNNRSDGLHIYRSAQNGSYVAGYPCTVAQGAGGGCGVVSQTVYIGATDISGNGGDGIHLNTRANNYGAVYSAIGRPAKTPTLQIAGSTVNGNHGDGLDIYNYVAGNSYGYQYVVALNSTFDNNHGDGIGSLSNVTTNSVLTQKTILYAADGTASASGNHGDGIAIDTQTTNGGVAANLLVVGYANVDRNGGDGIAVTDGAYNGAGSLTTGVAQYVVVIGSDVSHNQGYGINLRSRAVGSHSVVDQYLGVVGSTVDHDQNGVHAFEIAYSASSVGQNLYFSGDDISGNRGDGVYAVGIAVSQSFAEQGLNFSYKATTPTTISGNAGDGIYAGVAAFSGAAAEANIFVYDVNASQNHGDGLALGSGANGYGFGSAYIYYSHVTQNLIAAFDTFDRNGGNGVSISNTVYYGGTTNQFAELYDVDASHNGRNGFYETTHSTSIRGNSFSFTTNLTSTLYLIDSTFDHNAGDGISLNSYSNGAVYAPAFFGGYNYMIQHVQISGTSANGNGGSGLLVNANETGRYGLDGQYVTISGSSFDDNAGDGALFEANQYYGPGGFGVALEQVSISGSDFSGNDGNGLDLSANASGRQGRAEQHFTVSGSTFNNNGGDGVHIYASAKNGTYIAGHPCDTAQGLAGGCAFVRQSVVIVGSDISGSSGRGVFVGTYANDYGAIYGASGRPHAPTLELYGDTVDRNGGRGLDVSNHVSGNSYLYQYVAAIDSTFNNNHSDGIYLASYVGGGSTMLERALLYSYHTGASAHGNFGNGFKATIETLGGSYARDVNIVEGADLNHNGSFGFDGAVAYADGSSTGLQINAVYFNEISNNGDGIGLYSIGPGAQQISYIGDNTITHNAFVGAYGEANFGAFQYIGIYTFGNDVHANGTNYLFNSFGGSTQILN